ncbi:NAD(P)(+)--arginine ADP-ribosyltransferase 2-like [Xenentodon cancila]
MATWTLIVLMLGVTVGTSQNIIPLDMAPNSVDDMYEGCKDEMLTKVQQAFLPTEKSKVKNFFQAWDQAEKYYNNRWSPYNKKSRFSFLTKEQIMAVYAYTRDEVYSEFNTAVRTDKNKYKTAFMYHTLHFFLTDAIQALNCRIPEKKKCVTTYRGVNIIMKTDAKTFRFGSFTSSSMNFNIALRFGKKTCFVIYTCFGADISRYSKYEHEKEVMIPPYEVFEVVKSEMKSQKKTLPCDFVLTVKSTRRTQSKLNCNAF